MLKKKVIACHIGTIVLAFTGATSVFAAESFPTRSVRIIVNTAPGGLTDLTARLIAQGLSSGFHQPAIVDNRGGASGVIGIEIVARAPGDGYTLGLGSNSTFAIAPALYTNLSYDPFKSFAPISLFSQASLSRAVAFSPSAVVNRRHPFSEYRSSPLSPQIQIRPDASSTASTKPSSADVPAGCNRSNVASAPDPLLRYRPSFVDTHTRC